VSIREEGEAGVGAGSPYNVGYHVRTAWRLLVSAWQGILTALIYVFMTGSVVWLPVLVLIWLLVRRYRRAREARPVT
jgi:hypothetical protein